ncbi:orotate phosphoribosyltransferase [Plantactinospora sp. WMMB334]|uniref:orotate phosphoribosyltransferase n=1 Tax=Plantactinospora sp. WMMB334 TaxID=3404119 RepID=UPI003B93721E
MLGNHHVPAPPGRCRARAQGSSFVSAKEYGTNKAAEGGPVNGRRVVVIEDVVTTGGALLRSCGQLRSIGAQVETVVCAIDREQGGRASLAVEALQLRAALTRRELEASLTA